MTHLRAVLVGCTVLALGGCPPSKSPAGAAAPTGPESGGAGAEGTDKPAEDPILAAVKAPRSAKDTAMDAVRKPVEMLRFFEVKKGMKLAELGAGGGYTTSLLAAVVGSEGAVFAQNPKEWQQFAKKPWEERTKDGGLSNVTLLERAFDNPLPEEAKELDMVFSVLIYHDTAYMNIDRDAMNTAVAAALKPGGIYAVVDHHAEDGAGVSVVTTLHRIEKKIVIAEIEKAGFELLGEADFLRDEKDDHKGMAFGRPQPVTDRFVLKFRKR